MHFEFNIQNAEYNNYNYIYKYCINITYIQTCICLYMCYGLFFLYCIIHLYYTKCVKELLIFFYKIMYIINKNTHIYALQTGFKYTFVFVPCSICGKKKLFKRERIFNNLVSLNITYILYSFRGINIIIGVYSVFINIILSQI